MRRNALLLIALFLAPALARGDDAKRRPTDEQRGRELYERHCLACHGPTGKGDGPATAALVVPIPDLKGAVKTDKATVEVVVYGRGAMPAYEASFDAEDAKRVLRYMASAGDRAKPPAAEPAGPAGDEPAEAPEGPPVEGDGANPG